MRLKLYVVRHGETAWTHEGRYTGSRDVALSATGRRQCEAVAERLSRCPVAGIYASPLERARTSAEVIAEPHGLVVRIDPAFREIHFGEWEGLTRDEVTARASAAQERWRAEPHRFTPPSGEPLAVVVDRVTAGIRRLQALHDGEALILVTHGIVTRVIALAALGLGWERLWALDVAPASVTELEYRPEGTTIHCINASSSTRPRGLDRAASRRAADRPATRRPPGHERGREDDEW